jgi:N-acetylmuramoyl-L-alanine amidase
MVFYLNDAFTIETNKVSPTTIAFQLKKQAPISTSSSTTMKPTHQKFSKNRTLRGKTIVIDPGHGGNDPGAVRKNDYEKHYTLDISKRIQQKLIRKGAKVVMLRTKDTNPSLYQRVKKTNRSEGDFLISVHVNSFINDKANGTETYYYKKNEKLAAKYIQKHLTRNLNLKNNGIKRAKMYVLKYSKIPGVLIEPCFMTNKKEYGLLKTMTFREKIANATVKGLEEYFKNI